jgi:uncharacterized protein (TIGR00369 family)
MPSSAGTFLENRLAYTEATLGDDRTRNVTWQDPAALARETEGRTGLEFLRAVLERKVPPAAIQETLGFDLIAVEEGSARFAFTPGEHQCNFMGAVAGGVVCTLLDSATACAVMSTLDTNTAYATVDFIVHLTRAITIKTGVVVAEASVIHRGSRIATAQGRLVDGQGRVLAHGSSTCILLSRS